MRTRSSSASGTSWWACGPTRSTAFRRHLRPAIGGGGARDWLQGDDCDDNDPTVNPGQIEDVCCNGDGKDNDCDGVIDETEDSDVECNCFEQVDADGDGWFAGTDCDDADPEVNPGAEEICGNGRDDDCDGVECDDVGNGFREAPEEIPE